MRFTIEEAKQLLKAANIFHHNEDAETEDGGLPYTINFNDVWGWGMAWGEPVPEAELPRVAELFRRYGWCGILYWMSERCDGMRSEFVDNNRFIDFVRQEESLILDVPDSNARAYKKIRYRLG